MPFVNKSCSRTVRVSFGILLVFALLIVVLRVEPLALLDYANQAYAAKTPKGDLDRDGDIDLDDLQLFSLKWLGKNWGEVDWCQWVQDNPSMRKHLGGLYDFIMEYFQCGQPPEPNQPPPPADDLLEIKNVNRYPTRLAYGPEGKLFVSDAKVGSVFIYDPNLKVIGELKSLNRPLGVAVDSLGNIYVGSNGQDNVQVYNLDGVKMAAIGDGIIKMPNDLTFDRNDNLYVVDTLSNTVRVYDPNGTPLASIGAGGDGIGDFRSPIALTIAYSGDPNGHEVGELYVADRGHALIQVFDLDGNFVRSFGGKVSQGMMGWKWQGKFVRLQSLAVDGQGRLHAADCYMNNVQILDAQTGAYLDSYGAWGTAPGWLNLPLDIAIDSFGQVAVTNAENGRVEVIYAVP